jgi:itaconyl-CoA hydratase
MPKKYLDDFKVGDRIVTQAITITDAHLVSWAGLTMDFYPLHMDEEFAKSTPFGTRIAHGPLIFAMAIGLAYLQGFYEDSIIAWLGLENMRIPLPTRVGDTIRVEVEVKEKRDTSKPERGIGIFTYKIKNQKDEVVMIYDNLLLMHNRTS